MQELFIPNFAQVFFFFTCWNVASVNWQAGDKVSFSGAENEAAACEKEWFLNIDLACAWLGLPLQMCMLYSM